MNKDAEAEIQACVPCLSFSKENAESLKTTEIPKPWEKVHIDMYRPLPTGETILGITDASSR